MVSGLQRAPGPQTEPQRPASRLLVQDSIWAWVGLGPGGRRPGAGAGREPLREQAPGLSAAVGRAAGKEVED